MQGRRNWGKGGTVETCAHPMIFSDPNVPFFKSRIYEFSEPYSFWSRKLLTSTNHDFSVSGLLKIKFICSVCFRWFWPKILAFRPLTSHLSPFFVVWGHVINHSKRNFASSPIAQKRYFLSQVKGKSFHPGMTTRLSRMHILCGVWNLAFPT